MFKKFYEQELHKPFLSVGMTLDNHTVNVKEGDSVSLKCMVDSNPASEVTWTKGEKTLASSVTGQKLEVFLTHVKSSEADTYSCTALNKHGDTSDFVDIEVEGKGWNKGRLHKT